MLILVIAVAVLIIAVALLPQALAAFSASGPWLWVPVAFGIGMIAVAGGAIAANEPWDTLAGRFRWTVRVTLGVVLTVVCFFYAALMFIVPIRPWERHDNFWVTVLVGLFVWGMGAAFAYGGWHSVKSLVLGRER
jgi:hypothetical protein